METKKKQRFASKKAPPDFGSGFVDQGFVEPMANRLRQLH
jgi:hypothetical protein